MMKSRQDESLQSTALSTLIGYITGPKAEQPVGVRVVEPPPGTRQHQRGNLYAVAEIAGDHPDTERIADHLLNTLQRSYYTVRGSQSQVMLEAVNQAQRAFWEVQAQTDAHDLSAGMLCAALLGGRLMVVSAGAAFALVRTNDQVHMFPSELKQHKAGNMGQRSDGPEIFRQDVHVDDALFIGGGNWLSSVPVRTMASIVAFTNAETCSDAADELYEQSGRAGYAGLLIVFAPGSSSTQGGIAVSGSPPPTRPRRPRFGGLPTALGAPPPVRTPSHISAGVALSRQGSSAGVVATAPKMSGASPLSADTSKPAVEMAAIAPVESHAVQAPAPDESSPSSSGLEESNSHTPYHETSETDAVDEAEGASVGHKQPSEWAHRLSGPAMVGIRYARSMLSRMLPDSSRQSLGTDDVAGMEETNQAEVPQWQRAEWHGVEQNGVNEEHAEVNGDIYGDLDDDLEEGADDLDDESVVGKAVSLAMDAPAPHTLGGQGRTASVSSVSESTVTEPRRPISEPFSPPAPASGTRARLFTLIALLLLVAVPVVVAAITWERGASLRAEAEQLTQAAEGLLIAASAALDVGDRVSARQKLTEAQVFLADAIAIDGSNEHRSELAGSIESELQEVLQIKPLYALTSPLLTFPAEARPQDILVVDEDIFILDAGRQMIVHYQYDPAAGRIADEEGQIVVRQGDPVDGVVVGVLADMAWLPLITGYEDRPSLLILDRNNRVYKYDQRVEGMSLLNFAGEMDWRTVGQIQTYLGRIYIGDEGTGDIFRYAPGQYQEPPQLWFSNQTQVNLSGMIAMEIDGDIWLLFSNGMILRYSAGEQVPFSLENSIGLADEPVDLYVMNQDRTTLYLVDAAEDRILVYEKDGSYLHQLRAPEENLLRGLSGLFIDEVSNTMYILTQTAIFTHPLVE